MRFDLRRFVSASGALALTFALSSAAAGQGIGGDAISGRVIASDSTPIVAARVSATGEDGGTYRAETDAAGHYLLRVPGHGRYLVTAAAFGYTPFAADVVVPPEGGRVIRDLRLNPHAIQLDTLTATAGAAQLERPQKTPGEESRDWSSLLTEDLPIDPGDFADVAAFQRGVLRLGGDELSIAGQPATQNRTTVDGAGYGGTSLPAEGVRSIAVGTNTYDPARGQFSGGLIAARTISGTNLWGGALSTFLHDPNLRYGELPGGFGDDERRLRVSAGGGGPLLRDRLFVYGAADLSRTAGPRAFLDGSDPAALRRLQLAPDSVRRFLDIARELGLDPATGAGDSHSDFASALGRIDYTLSERHALTARLDWRRSTSTGLGASPLRLAGTAGELRSSHAGVFAQLTSGWGLWSNELRAYRSVGDTRAAHEAPFPTGRLRVASAFDDGTMGFSFLDFGGVPFLLPKEDRSLWEVADEVVRESDDGDHRFKIGVLLQEERSSLAEVQNRFGTFSFNSLADLENGRPASFTRTSGGEQSQAIARYGAVYAADTWRVSDAFSVIGGLRLEGSRYAGRPAVGAAVNSLGTGGSGAPPSDLVISPRAGFTWQVPGQADVDIRGGLGRFRGIVPLRPLASLWSETGGDGSPLRLVCVGPAAPAPDWTAYDEPAAIPTACADGSPAFADRAPPVTLFGDG